MTFYPFPFINMISERSENGHFREGKVVCNNSNKMGVMARYMDSNFQQQQLLPVFRVNYFGNLLVDK